MDSAARLPFGVPWGRLERGPAGAGVSGVALGAFGAPGPVYGYEVGLEADQIAAFMGISILAAMLIQWPMGFVSDYLLRRPVIVSVTGEAAGLALTHDVLDRHQIVPASATLLLALHAFAREEAPRVSEQSHCAGVAPVSTAVIMELDRRQECG